MATIHTVTNEAARGCGYREEGGFYLMGSDAMEPCGGLPIRLETCPCCSEGFKVQRVLKPFNPKRLFEIMRDPIYQIETETELPTIPCGVNALGDVGGVSIHWGGEPCQGCLIAHPPEKAGLLWIGKRSYTPVEFLDEAQSHGISRRLNRGTLPDWLKLGETVIYLAHIEAAVVTCGTCDGSGVTLQAVGTNVSDGQLFEVACKPGKCPDCKGKKESARPGIFATFIPTHAEYIVKGTETEAELDKIEERGFRLVKLERTDGEGKKKKSVFDKVKERVGL